MNPFVLYTYQTVNGQLVCHAYGASSQQQAQTTGENLQASARAAQQPELDFMVLPLEPLPV